MKSYNFLISSPTPTLQSFWLLCCGCKYILSWEYE